MPEEVEANGAEVSDAMSENEHDYDDPDHTIKTDGDDTMAEHNTTSPEAGTEGSGEVKKKYDPKDPHRPRRKKARRACFACQRAHLTCGKDQPLLSSSSYDARMTTGQVGSMAPEHCLYINHRHQNLLDGCWRSRPRPGTFLLALAS